MRGGRLGWLLLVLWGALAGGCAQLAYYGQSIGGELQVLSKRRPISAVVADPDTPAALRGRLREAERIREFAVRRLHLPDNGSYTTYADIGRPYVVWNVFAAPRFALKLKTWCFPIAGCVGYRGYFHHDAALAEAARLRKQGLDVYVAGIPAYSTLGWFSDPLLSTVVDWPDFELAGLIFHELAHARVYVPGATTFNESFAVTVQRVGVRRWLAARGSPAERADYQAYRARRHQFLALVLATQARLKHLYESGTSQAGMRAGKRRIIADLRHRYRALKAEWGGYDGYDRWFDGPLNNAQLGSVVTYEDDVPAFRALLTREGGSLPDFYAAVARLGKLPTPERERRLAALAGAGQDRPASRPARRRARE
ncbi:MAG: aminopeptidase [Gammaproteobacteria bacterium]